MSSASAPLSPPLAARAGRAGRLAGSPTLRFIIRRLLAAIPVLFGVTFLCFVVMNSLPGDAAQELLGASATPSEIHQLEVKLGLDKPFLTRYWDWLHQAVIGHLGHSLSSGQSVGSILGADLPVTFELVAFAFLISLALAVPIALVSARKPNGVADRLSMIFSMAGLSVAPYVLALVLIYVFAVKLNVLQRSGWFRRTGLAEHPVPDLAAVSIGLGLLCSNPPAARGSARADAGGGLRGDRPRAKGLRPWRVLTRHALRNSLFGLITGWR